MVPPSGDSMSRSDIRSARSVAIVASALVLLGASLSLAGWLIPSERLTDWNGEGINIKFNCALAIVFASAGILLYAIAPRLVWPARVFGFLAALLGFATLVQHLLDVDLRIDNLFVTEPHDARATVSPGRMGPPASTMLTLLGTSIVMLTLSAGKRRLASAFALITLTISSLSLTGYLFGADQLYSIPHLTGIAAQT